MKKPLEFTDIPQSFNVHCYESLVEVNMTGHISLYEIQYGDEEAGDEKITQSLMGCAHFNSHQAERFGVIFTEMAKQLKATEEERNNKFRKEEAKKKLAKTVNSKVAKAKVAAKKLPRAAKIAKKVANTQYYIGVNKATHSDMLHHGLKDISSAQFLSIKTIETMTGLGNPECGNIAWAEVGKNCLRKDPKRKGYYGTVKGYKHTYSWETEYKPTPRPLKKDWVAK